MGDLVSLDSARPHTEGPMRCLGCKHQWRGVAPVGTDAFECPECGCQKGVRFTLVLPADGNVWVCACENWFYILTGDGKVLCPNCGRLHLEN